MSIQHQYLHYQDKYTKKYGNKTLVLMQVGSFHECYSTNDRGYDLKEISEILNIQYTRKDKKKEGSESNPFMVGFPTISLQKFLKILPEYANLLSVLISNLEWHRCD